MKMIHQGAVLIKKGKAKLKSRGLQVQERKS
jgi:hypothetical protein